MQFYAIQVLAPAEPVNPAIWDFTQAAVAKGKAFKTLQVFGHFTVGRFKFLRFRTDCAVTPDLVDQIVSISGRGFIAPSAFGYRLRLPVGDKGSVSMLTMQATALPGYPVTFRGPLIKFWERQFEGVAGAQV